MYSYPPNAPFHTEDQQCIQNSAAHLICSQPAYTRATSLLRKLHWLPVEKHIVYKLSVLMFDIKYGSAPAYLADLCNVRTDERLRSTSHGDFVILRTRTSTADSEFMVAVPNAWNALPSELKTITSKTIFCNRLKTHLFICPIAVACSMGQIIKSVCVCQCVRLRALSRSHFLIDFHQNWHGQFW